MWSLFGSKKEQCHHDDNEDEGEGCNDHEEAPKMKETPEEYFAYDTRGILNSFDRERVKINYIRRCEVYSVCGCHANQECQGEYSVPIFGCIWKGCGRAMCLKHVIDEYD